MLNAKTILAIIPARGGSKGIPFKNIKILGGKPLIAWTIEEAKKSKYIDRLILSSEDEQIITAAREWGCEVPFVRPTELAKDDTPGIEPVLHAVNSLEVPYDCVMLLQPTSPLRSVEDIDNCIAFFMGSNAPACVSVTEVEHSPYWMYEVDDHMRMYPLMKSAALIGRRQDLPKLYELNGAIYIAKTSFVIDNKTFHTEQTIAYPMPAARSIDIDSELDLAYCEWLIDQDSSTKDKQ